jgi:hypothetical protein
MQQDRDREEDHENDRRNYKTRHQVQVLLAEMEKQICEGKSDEEIIKFFEMKERVNLLLIGLDVIL